MSRDADDFIFERWRRLGQAEVGAATVIRRQLAPLEEPVRLCLGLGVRVPTLGGQRQGEQDMRVAALFLKRALNDLRSVWLLCTKGYTSQAGAVAAALFENALVASCVAGKPERAAAVLASASGDLPWSPMKLCRMQAERDREDAHELGRDFGREDYERAWRTIYAGYKWLCKIKHPTLPSVAHDAHAASTKGEEFIVMALPDVREENVPVKATVLTIAVSRCSDATERFAFELKCDQAAEACRDFAGLLYTLKRKSVEAFRQLAESPLPFTLLGTHFETHSRRWLLKSRP